MITLENFGGVHGLAAMWVIYLAVCVYLCGYMVWHVLLEGWWYSPKKHWALVHQLEARLAFYTPIVTVRKTLDQGRVWAFDNPHGYNILSIGADSVMWREPMLDGQGEGGVWFIEGVTSAKSYARTKRGCQAIVDWLEARVMEEDEPYVD